MKTDTATLNDLIEVLEDGAKFYQEAAGKVSRADLRALFGRMATTKGAIASDLMNVVRSKGEKPAQKGSVGGSLRKAFAEVRASFSSDKDFAYVAELEQFEDRILSEFRDAVEKSDDPDVRAIAKRYLPEVTRDHATMRDLKHSRAA
jgi:uncharacterized protein (TIGR02284 family)